MEETERLADAGTDPEGSPKDQPLQQEDGKVNADSHSDMRAGLQEAPNPDSKNQQKKRKRKEEWEAGRAGRKVRRKEKIAAKKVRKREAKLDHRDADDNETGLQANADASLTSRSQKAVQVPVTLIIDCQFGDLMYEKELISLGSQITRAYSENKKSPMHTHLVVSSFVGSLKDRFEGILARHHESWNGVRFREGNFVDVAQEAKGWMEASKGGSIAGALLQRKGEQDADDAATDDRKQSGEVVYLTSESPNTLHELKPYSTYVIGGLVDKNRHKGICYKRALDHGIATAKLPIGDFLDMRTRAVLATNHVIEIMLLWLESGDWAEAFTKVMPKRKGGAVKAPSKKTPEKGSDARADLVDGPQSDDSDGSTAEDVVETSAETGVHAGEP